MSTKEIPPKLEAEPGTKPKSKPRRRGKRGAKKAKVNVDLEATPGAAAGLDAPTKTRSAGSPSEPLIPPNHVNLPEADKSGSAKSNPEKKPKKTRRRNRKKIENNKTADIEEDNSPAKESQEAVKTPVKKNGRNKKQAQFPPHYIEDQVKMALDNKLLVRGVLRINPKMFEDAYIRADDEYNDVLISGVLNRNRALNGDEVAVDFLPEKEWKVLHLSVAEYLEEQGLEDIPGALLVDDLVDKVNGLEIEGQKGRKESEKSREGKEFNLNNVKNLPNWTRFVQKTGRVVAILEKVHKRKAMGYLKDRVGDAKYAVFSPTDSRVPRMLILRRDLPPDFITQPKLFAKTLFVAGIKFWDEPRFAMGQLVKNIGDDSSVENYTAGILTENDVDDSEFSDLVINCLPKLPFVITEQEIIKRKDFRRSCVFTIDPLTARDLDDALSIEKLDEDTFSVGVHIADVSHFVSQHTALDRTAKERSTSVYLVQKVIPMLPRELSEHLCSLNPGEDKLTFSVEWTIKNSGEIVDTRFGKSVINSCVKLSYEQAQEMLDNPEKHWELQELPNINGRWTVEDVVSRVNMLNAISLNLKRGRVDEGALRLNNPKMCFMLNPETGLPISMHPYKTKQSNSLIEEFMLLANISVAEKIHQHFPKISLLRCHPAPKQNVMDGAVKLLQSYGIHLDASSSKRLHETLERYRPNGATESEARHQLILSLVSKPMQNARYFCTGWYDNPDEYYHYALSVPLYTHFTSPIRRYPDIIVHRLLNACINDDKLDWITSDIQKTATHCNAKKLNAKKCSQESEELFYAKFIKESSSLDVDAVVIKVLDRSLDCLILNNSIVKRVYLENQVEASQIKKIEAVRDNNGGVKEIQINWPEELNEGPDVQVVGMFSAVNIRLFHNPNKKALDIKAELLRPSA